MIMIMMEDEIYFWKNAMGMRVTRVDEVAEKKEEGGGKPKAAFLAFGQETLDADDGAKAGVEIRARGGGGNGAPGVVGTGLAYVSLYTSCPQPASASLHYSCYTAGDLIL